MSIYSDFVREFNAKIESICTEFVDDSDSELKEMYLYSVMSGRKYRPTLVLTGKLIGDTGYDENTLRLAVAVELIHKYSLILDDSVDNDPLRRGETTYYHKYGRDNAQAMSAYLMNLLYKELRSISRIYRNDKRADSILSFYEEILSDMAVGFISDLNKKSRDVRGIRRISDMQTTTLLRNSMLIGFVCSDYYEKHENGYLLTVLEKLGNCMGTVFQAYNDIEVFCGHEFQQANKGHLFPDFFDNRKNIVLAKVPIKIFSSRDTNELISYINKNKLFEEVFNEVFDVLKDIRQCIIKLPDRSTGRRFLMSFLEEKEESIFNLSRADIFNFNDINSISAI